MSPTSLSPILKIKPLVYGGNVWPYNELAAGFKSMRLDNLLFCAAWAAAAWAAVVWLTWFNCPSWFNWEWFKAAKEDFDGFNDGIDLLNEPAIGMASWCLVFTMWQLKSFKMNENDENVLENNSKDTWTWNLIRYDIHFKKENVLNGT